MVSTVRMAVSIQKTLLDQVETLAQHLNISRSHLLGLAIENYVRNYSDQSLLDRPEISPLLEAQTAVQGGARRRLINQGDIYWVSLDEPDSLEPGFTHPYVVIQDNIFNRSRINTVLVCALTSNIKRAKAPGNVLLEMGEANLPRLSVVEVSKISTVDKTQLGEYIGSLSGLRINQILAGLQFLQLMTEPREMDPEK